MALGQRRVVSSSSGAPFLWKFSSGEGYRSSMSDHQQRTPPPGSRKQASQEIIGANSEIGRKLRQFYDEIASESVPDRFAQLLDQLDKAETSRNGE